MAVNPDQVAQVVRKAMQLQTAGRLSEAAVAYEVALREIPEQPDCWYNLGLVRRSLRLFRESLDAYELALQFGVESPEEVHLNRAVIYSDFLRRFGDAEQELLLALRKRPEYIPALFNLGNLYVELGRIEEARAVYSRVLDADPECYDALARLATIETPIGCPVVDVGTLRSAMSSNRATTSEKASVGFALAAVLDRLGDYHGAFNAALDANAFSAACAPLGNASYDAGKWRNFVDRSISCFRPDRAIPSLQQDMRPPIFICGLPGPAIAIIERHLAQHPAIAAGGELDLVPRLVSVLPKSFPDSSTPLLAEHFARMADAYVSHLKVAFPVASIVSDSRPDNFLYLGLIKSMFPDAKVVHVVRHPLDACASLFFQNLDYSMNFARDLPSIAHFYGEYSRLMAHWHSCYGGDLIDLSFDAYKENSQLQLRRLVDFCGLQWHQSLLDSTDRELSTKQPWSVPGHWRLYDELLAPLKLGLGDLCPA